MKTNYSLALLLSLFASLNGAFAGQQETFDGPKMDYDTDSFSITVLFETDPNGELYITNALVNGEFTVGSAHYSLVNEKLEIEEVGVVTYRGEKARVYELKNLAQICTFGTYFLCGGMSSIRHNVKIMNSLYGERVYTINNTARIGVPSLSKGATNEYMGGFAYQFMMR